MADVSLTARANEVWVAESPQDGVAGEIYEFTLTVPYATTISAGKNTAFRDRTDVSATVFASTVADGTSGNVLTADTLTPVVDVAGRYVIVFKYVNGNQTENKKLLLRIGKQAYTP
jgi:hypothetical protein